VVWYLESATDVSCSGNEDICCGCRRHDYFGWEPFKCVADACGTCLPNVNFEAAIRFKSWAEVPSVDRMRSPSATVGWFFMDKDADARRC
jgi:hypothetical protein